ncbi:MAG: hypothetical protein IT454_09770 [Planctomycetes bacterium]|nr:hypothetical protein [Planctomycetota bacterium]
MRLLLALFALCTLSTLAPADIIAIRFKDPKTATKHKDNAVLRGGELMLVGEKYEARSKDNTTVVIVANSDDPLKVPYKFNKAGELDGVKDTVSIANDQIAGTILLSKDGTLMSLAQDYSDRRRDYEDHVAARNAQAKGSPAWMVAHQRVLLRGERLKSWLESMCYPGAALKLEKELAKERKLATEATASRLETARNSVKTGSVPEDLTRVAQEVSGGTDKYAVQESMHCRIIYRDGIDELRVKQLLELAEEVIDGWRVEFVDPYLDETFEDFIQDHTFIEWFFAYDDIPKSEAYMTKFYKMGFQPEHKEESLLSEGHGIQRGMAPEYAYYWRIGEGNDLEGIVTHNLGHVLANIHFDKRRMGMEQDWLEEACGLWISLEWLGRNSANCKAWAEPGKYVHQAKKSGEKTAQIGLRDWYNTIALQAGSTLDKLFTRSLFEMGDGDLAKAWSFFDWIAKKNGLQGQLFLRQCCNLSRTKNTFLNDLRAKTEEIYELQGVDAYKEIDKRWKDFAETGQDTGDTKKK